MSENEQNSSTAGTTGIAQDDSGCLSKNCELRIQGCAERVRATLAELTAGKPQQRASASNERANKTLTRKF
jgi:hypothetical protein